MREKACESINSVAGVLSTAQIQEYYLVLLKRLSGGEWFTSRTSAASLFASVYNKVPAAQQSELRGMFAMLCHDETPMVRRAAARYMNVRAC